MTLPANTLYLRKWKLNVYGTKIVGSQVVPNTSPDLPHSELQSTTPGSLHITATHPATKPVPISATEGLDLSQFRTTFEVNAADTETPNLAIIRIYNVSPQTAAKLTGGYTGLAGLRTSNSEFTRVVLQCGYDPQGDGSGVVGTIFDGQIKQVFVGRESATDTFVIIHAADGDDFFNFSIMSVALAAGASKVDIYNAIKANATQQGLLTWDQNNPNILTSVGGVLPRGKVLWGMTRVYLTQLADASDCSWSIQNGKVIFIPRKSPGVGPFVKLNAQTGMIGIPVQTNQGIVIKSLINPQIVVGTRLQVNNKDIVQGLLNLNRANLSDPLGDPSNLLAHLTDDGTYRVFAIDYKGDSRGNEWYMNLTCLAVDPSTGVPLDASPGTVTLGQPQVIG